MRGMLAAKNGAIGWSSNADADIRTIVISGTEFCVMMADSTPEPRICV
jgi:hypothetical protein